jgi:voltage-gated potassium channel Kch
MSDTKRPTTPRALIGFDAYRVLVITAIGLVILGTVVYRLLEDWSLVDSLYFSVIAVTTVGFGDLVPSTDTSKLFTVVYVLWGISIITTYLDQRLKHRTVSIAQREGATVPEAD